jgi:hypothetical protein
MIELSKGCEVAYSLRGSCNTRTGLFNDLHDDRWSAKKFVASGLQKNFVPNFVLARRKWLNVNITSDSAVVGPQHTVIASNFGPHGNAGPFLANSVASLGELSTKNEQNRFCKPEVLLHLQFSVGCVLMIRIHPKEKIPKLT